MDPGDPPAVTDLNHPQALQPVSISTVSTVTTTRPAASWASWRAGCGTGRESGLRVAADRVDGLLEEGPLADFNGAPRAVMVTG